MYTVQCLNSDPTELVEKIEVAAGQVYEYVRCCVYSKIIRKPVFGPKKSAKADTLLYITYPSHFLHTTYDYLFFV